MTNDQLMLIRAQQTLESIDNRRRQERQERVEARLRRRAERLKKQRSTTPPPAEQPLQPLTAPPSEWWSDDEEAERRRALGYDLEVAAANTVPPRKHFETSNDSAVAMMRIDKSREIRAYLDELWKRKRAADAARAATLASGSVDCRHAPLDVVRARMAELGLDVGFGGPQLHEPGTMELPAPRPSPTWRDSIIAARERERAAVQQTPQPKPADYLEQVIAGARRRGGGG